MSEGVIENQREYRADGRNEETVKVEPSCARCSKGAEHPAARNSTGDTEQDVERHASASPICDLAADDSRNQPEDYPSKKWHSLSRLSRR